MDVFQVVKALRIQKPGSVLTVVSTHMSLAILQPIDLLQTTHMKKQWSHYTIIPRGPQCLLLAV